MKFEKYLVAAVLSAASLVAQAADDIDIKWPDVGSGWLKKGTFIDVEQLMRIGPDMNKDQVRELISYPQFSEGFFGPRQWNYVFNFRTGNGYEYVACQYQLVFNKRQKVESMHWREPACANYVTRTKPAETVVNQTYPVTLTTDGMFVFGKSSLNDLLPAGKLRLQDLATQIKTGFSNVHDISVVGYTDRIGSFESNLSLSRARAETAKRFLMDEGVNGNLIHTSGVGPDRPVVFCPGAVTPKVIACLMPNRRIEVSVNGDK